MGTVMLPVLKLKLLLKPLIAEGNHDYFWRLGMVQVQHLIEKCLMFDMDHDDFVKALAKYAKIKPIVTLTGVAVGSGWQTFIAYVSIVCYYIIRVPLGMLFGWDLVGMIFGTAVQTIVLIFITWRIDWDREVLDMCIYTARHVLYCYGGDIYWQYRGIPQRNVVDLFGIVYSCQAEFHRLSKKISYSENAPILGFLIESRLFSQAFFDDNDNQIETLITKIKAMFCSMSNGEINPSAYDTAWIARVSAINGSAQPRFPQALKWVLNNQLADGLDSIRKHAEEMVDEADNHTRPSKFDMVFLAMLNDAKILGLDLPYELPFMK
eukprot:Gb_10756 [translate_table: standard]